MTQTPAPAAADLAARLADVTAVDERRLRGRLRSVRRITDDAKRERVLTDVDRQVRTAEARMARRLAAVPTLRYPPELPVSDRVDDLAAAIAANQVVIVAGETGSGKSTQLPKICLQIGRGVRGTIGHTQPRRIAARALAERIAEACLLDRRVQLARVRVEKLDIFADATSAGVEIERRRSDLSTS